MSLLKSLLEAAETNAVLAGQVAGKASTPAGSARTMAAQDANVFAQNTQALLQAAEIVVKNGLASR